MVATARKVKQEHPGCEGCLHWTLCFQEAGSDAPYCAK